MKTFTGNIATAMAACIEDANKRVLRACIDTVNTQAGMTRKNAIQNIQSNFTNRNKFTANSVRFTQCPKSVKRLEDVASYVGITERAGYMERQEKGGQHINTSGNQLAIPTAFARGGTNKKTVKQGYRLNRIQTVKGPFAHAGSKKSETVARAFVSKNEKKVIRYDDKLFQVTSFKKKGDNIQFQMKEVYTFKYKSTTTQPKPWLEPATIVPRQQGQGIFNSKM